MPRSLHEASVCLALVAIVILSGCLGESPGPPALPSAPSPLPSPSAPSPPPSFGAPTLVGGGGVPGLDETSLAIGPDGTMLVCGLEDSGNPIFASEDGGASWRALYPLQSHPTVQNGTGNGDCDVAIGHDGAWYTVFSTWSRVGTDYVPTMVLAISPDGGSTWEWRVPTITLKCYDGPLLLPQACWMHRPWLRPVGGDLYLTYYGFVPPVAFFQKSSNGGRDWSAPVAIWTANDRQQMASVGRMEVADGGGTVFVPIHGFGGNHWLDLAVSADAGASWIVTNVAGPMESPPGFLYLPSIARADSGDLYYAVPLANGSRTDVAFSISRDEGRTWSEPLVVASSLDLGGAAFIALDAAADGGAVAAWHRWEETGGRTGWVLTVARLDAGATGLVTWSRDITRPTGKEGKVEFFTLDHDAASRIHIVYPVPERPCASGGDFCRYHVVGEAGERTGTAPAE